MSQVYIGTSGFSYPHWGNGIFYPQGLSQTKWFEYYCQHFKTVELNVSFYRLPKKEVFAGWRKKAGEKFVFSVKGSRYITHIKRLKDCREAVERFFEAAGGLKGGAEVGRRLSEFSNANVPAALGLGIRPAPSGAGSREDVASRQPSPRLHDVILWQLPPGFKANPERLEEFLLHLRGGLRHLGGEWGHAFEFRHESWLDKKIYKILEKHNSAVVFQDYPDWPITEEITADFIYLRFHGKTSLYSSCYSKKELGKWAEKIKQWKRKGLDIYAYFNNDALGHAAENAKALKALVQSA